MAELLLTDEEKEAATWFELDDAVLGKVVKRTAAGLIGHSRELDRVWWFAAAMLLCGMAHDQNAQKVVQSIEGFEEEGVPLGDWEVIVQRVSSATSGQMD